MSVASNVGKWDDWHTTVKPFGEPTSYSLGADWLGPCESIEDWGAGAGYLSKLIDPIRYTGIDGSPGPCTTVIADLTTYRSQTSGLFMRHVLEHNFEWKKILDNALSSFTERMFLVLFTPLADETHDTEFEDPPGVPNLSFRLGDITNRIDCIYGVEHLGNAMPYGLREPKLIGTETIFRLMR